MAKKSATVGDVAPSYHDYEAENDLRHLIESEKIKADKPRMRRAMKKHAELKKHLNAVKC